MTTDTESIALQLAPIDLKAANAYVSLHHRHHKASRGHKFSVAVVDEQGAIRGVAIASKPRAGSLSASGHLEVVRVCTDGAPNACSMLYGAVARAAVAMGYRRHQVITYTLLDEPGTSLRAAGSVQDHTTRGESWDRPGRRRVDAAPTTPKRRWRAAPMPTTEAPR